MDVELHDWEMLDDPSFLHNTSYLDGIERESEGIIRPDYFSIDSHNKYVEDVTDQISVESDNPSWIDPVCDTNYTKTKPIGELWTPDDSDDGRYVESEASNNELGVVDIADRQVAYGESFSDSSEIESEHDIHQKIDDSGDDRVSVGVWWKLPFDLLKYCLFKASPVWTLSVAAAMMGVVILGRRLYRMKQKTRRLQLKVAIDDDKKVSQVMTHAERLNEAFSVVKRVPIIRPSLPAGTGIVQWPVMALR